jgi:hypothetical protein
MIKKKDLLKKIESCNEEIIKLQAYKGASDSRIFRLEYPDGKIDRKYNWAGQYIIEYKYVKDCNVKTVQIGHYWAIDSCEVSYKYFIKNNKVYFAIKKDNDIQCCVLDMNSGGVIEIEEYNFDDCEWIELKR